MSEREGGRVGAYQGVWRQSKLEVREGAPGEVEVAEVAPGEVRARAPATSSEIEVGEGAPVAEPERTARPGSTNRSPREVVRACAQAGEVGAYKNTWSLLLFSIIDM